MSSTKSEQQDEQIKGSFVRGSSLVVNLSTTKKRSSITTLHTSTSIGGSRSIARQYFSCNSGDNNSVLAEIDSSMNEGGTSFSSNSSAGCGSCGSRLIDSGKYRGPQSAPPSLSKPCYSSCTSQATSSDNVEASGKHLNGFIDEKNINQSIVPYCCSQVIQLDQAKKNKTQGGSSRNDTKGELISSNEKINGCSNSPEPIVEVRHTSSSSPSSSSSSQVSSKQNSPSSSDCESKERNSTKLIRRRTVKRYHRGALVEQTEEATSRTDGNRQTYADLKISLTNKEEEPDGQKEKSEPKEAKSYFRTRPIGSFHDQTRGQTQTCSKSAAAASSSSSISESRIASKSTITTSNRKSTTSRHHHHQLISESSSSRASSSEQIKRSDASTLPTKTKTQTQIPEPKPEPGSDTAEASKMNNADNSSLPVSSEMVNSRSNRSPSSLELRLKDQFKGDLFERADDGLREKKSYEEEESRRIHREESSCFSRSSRTSLLDGSLRQSAVSRSAASEAAALQMSRHSKLGSMSADVSASSSRHFESSASLLLSGNKSINNDINSTTRFADLNSAPFFNSEAVFSSPDVRSLVQEIGSEFAELESALTNRNSVRAIGTNPIRLLCKRPLSPVASNYPAILDTNHHHLETKNIPSKPPTTDSAAVRTDLKDQSNFSCSLNELTSRLDKSDDLLTMGGGKADETIKSSDKIRELMERVGDNNGIEMTTKNGSTILIEEEDRFVKNQSGKSNAELSEIQDQNRKAFMSESIERIDQKMSDLCKKLQEYKNTKDAIDLLKIMIQMIEKAWSVPVCGDDLGFKLCNSLREAGGLDVILGFVHQGSEELEQATSGDVRLAQRSITLIPLDKVDMLEESGDKQKNEHDSSNPLRLKINDQFQNDTNQTKASCLNKDSDSDMITSDLGLDSTSVDSLSYVSANHATSTTEDDKRDDGRKTETDECAGALEEGSGNKEENNSPEEVDMNADLSEEDEERLDKEELVLLSGRLLSQCLTSDNRHYIVGNLLDSVIKLACNYTMMKNNQFLHLYSPYSMLIRQASSSSSTNERKSTVQQPRDGSNNKLTELKTDSDESVGANSKEKLSVQSEHSDKHAIIGTEILQHLFKHSEETCYKMISLGGLQAILYGCRSSNTEILRHCASALANLALYSGPEGQQMMIEQKAHVWLFPLAFHEDDNVQYYACLAIVVLAANKEIEADVLKSSTLDLVEPFVTSHEPQKFAESTTSHIHGQSPNWLRKLIPLLESKREEAKNLACFHFAMEAYIKREQSQTKVFKDIGAVEPLRKVGSSPQAIASKFACQALRLIGEKEPHKLSQQVPLWTSEDVVEWVSQIGFQRFRQVFIESRVDGDLLLQLDEEMLKTDIGIDNGIIRRRFLRELSNLKRISDYSSVDKSGLCSILSSNGQEFIQYVYPMLQLGVTKDNIHLLDCDQLLRECKVANTIHHLKLAQAIKSIQEKTALAAATQEVNSQNGAEQKTLDVFVSYRRSTGSQLASLLKVHLQLRGFSVFIDVERLEAGKFDNNLLDSVKTAKNFIIVLSPNALDRCIDDHECKDWVHKEIVAALGSNCNIIPIIDNFHWPDPEQLPEDMRSIIYFNGVRWIHDYQDACVDKVERFIRGEINNTSQFGGSQLSSSSAQSSLQRLPGANGGAYSISTPSIAATPSLVGGHIVSGYQYTRPPFDSDHHPLALASQQLAVLQHPQGGQPITSNRRQ